MPIHSSIQRGGWSAVLVAIALVGALVQTSMLFAQDRDPPRPAPEPGDFTPAAPPGGMGPGFVTQKSLQWLMQQQPGMGAGMNIDPGKYWIGAECREAPPELVAQLGLKEGEGLVVVRLLDDSPGAKAGLKQHDVLLSIGETKLGHVPELIKAVNAAEGKELSLKIIRGGKEQTIAVTPAERPQDNLRVIARPGPGMMFGSGNVERLKIPDNVSITVTRQGTNPPKVTISRGDEKWEVNKPEELEKLPEELRPIAQGLMAPPTRVQFPDPNGPPSVTLGQIQYTGNTNLPQGTTLQQMLGNLAQGNGPDGRQGPPGDRQGPPPGGPHNSAGPGQVPPELMQRLDQLDRQLQMLQDQIRSLRDGGQQGRARGDNPPQDGQRQGPDGERRGPPGGGGRRGPPDGNRQGPPPEGDRGGPPPDGPR